jgi:predicted nucleic acid-binding protein
MAFVLDCSMTMAWVFSDEANEFTEALRESLLKENAVAPALWPIEVGNVLLVAMRRGRIVREDWVRIREDLSALPIDIDPDSYERVLDTVLDTVLPIADEHGLSVYDAMYLELALRRGLPLATLDRKLVEAANTAGIETLCS